VRSLLHFSIIGFVAFECAAFAQEADPFPSNNKRLEWAFRATLNPGRIAGTAFSSAISTANNNPEEFGPGWPGFGKRFGTRMFNRTVQNIAEVEVGSLWNEDPRYYPLGQGSFGRRFLHVLKMTVAVRRTDGSFAPAYARYIAVPSVSALSNAWRPESERTAGQTALRIPMSFVNRIIGNSFSEFWPDLRRRMSRK
jgi:hypothetical protein